MARKYDPRASQEVEKTMHGFKEGKFVSREQAIAAGLDIARRKGKRVPKKSAK